MYCMSSKISSPPEQHLFLVECTGSHTVNTIEDCFPLALESGLIDVGGAGGSNEGEVNIAIDIYHPGIGQCSTNVRSSAEGPGATVCI